MKLAFTMIELLVVKTFVVVLLALLTLSYWQSPHDLTVRGSIDLNFTYDDGSINRMNQVEYHDDRIVRVQTTQSPDDGWNGGQVPSS